MLNIGIVGAENSHTAAIAKVLNVEKRVRGVRVTHVWGETAQYAQAAAAVGQIPHIVRTPEELIGQVDGAVVDHRHGKEHLPAAWPLLEAKIPLFIDKPFCYRRAEGKRFFLWRGLRSWVCRCVLFRRVPKQASDRHTGLLPKIAGAPARPFHSGRGLHWLLRHQVEVGWRLFLRHSPSGYGAAPARRGHTLGRDPSRHPHGQNFWNSKKFTIRALNINDLDSEPGISRNQLLRIGDKGETDAVGPTTRLFSRTATAV